MSMLHCTPLVITTLAGGLGNQMFQYAAGRALAERLKARLVLDRSFYELANISRSYHLHAFNIQEHFADPNDLALFTNKINFFEKLINRNSRGVVLNEDPAPQFIPKFFTVSGNVHLKGYWQSEQYFDTIRSTLRHEFTPRTALDPVTTARIERIKGCTSVCIHVRRGDYVTDAVTNAFHGTCSLDYYQRAIEHLSRELTSPTFFVFSDDPAWAKENLHLTAPTEYVQGNTGIDAFKDLLAMSNGAHFIIANSSFSWWAAWLGTRKGKKIIAPRRWFSAPNVDDRHIVPSQWERL